jgi:hypothetical protein
MALLDDLLANRDLSRILVVAIAAQSIKLDASIDCRALVSNFRKLIHSLDRSAFSAELRQLERLGAKAYLEAAAEKLKNAR